MPQAQQWQNSSEQLQHTASTAWQPAEKWQNFHHDMLTIACKTPLRLSNKSHERNVSHGKPVTPDPTIIRFNNDIPELLLPGSNTGPAEA